ncbi:MAG TPA: Gfo/Idh/MocA family oxidoreductase [Conexibacter sp.]|nr:Gfo/Idh/MocA family oxidoreductase [Conexibacter sp.]
MSEPVRVALIGAGDIGRNAHLPALLAHPAVELAAIVEPSAEQRALVQAPGVPLLESVDALPEPLDAWVVATPPWVTPALARRGVEEGRFVLAEKPIATSVEAARAAFGGLAPAALERLQIGFTYRHDPAIERLRELIADGTLGGPLQVRVIVYDELDDPADEEHAARMRATLEHGPPVIHEGAHVADWLRVLLGPQELAIEHAWSLRTDATLPADNLCGASLLHPDGHRITVEIGWLLPAVVRSEITVRGAGGCATIEIVPFSLRVETRSLRSDQIGAEDRTTRCFRIQLDRFVALCRGERDAAVPLLDDGIAALALTERLGEAMR